MKHDFEERQQRRIDNAKARITKNEREADRQLDIAHKSTEHIPPGQPILVGHYSERRHRRALEQSHNAMSKSRTASEKADYYRDRVAAMEGNTAISSDDPKAIEKLTAKLLTLQEHQEFMKAANKCIRKGDKEAFLLLDCGTETLWKFLNTPGRFGGNGYAHFNLTNNNANIRRITLRLAELKALAGRESTEKTVKGVIVRENSEANRVQLLFPTKPQEDVRQWLHKHGFHWCVKDYAWQRLLNKNSLHEVKAFFEWYNP